MSAPELIADAGPVSQDVAAEGVTEASAAADWAAMSAEQQVPAQGAAPAPVQAPEPALAMAGAAMAGAAGAGTLEAPAGYGPAPAGYGPPAPAYTPPAPAYMPEPSRYPAAPTAGLVAPVAAPPTAQAAPATHLAPPAPRLPGDATMPPTGMPQHATPAAPSDVTGFGGPATTSGSVQTLEAGGQAVADPGLAPPPARPGAAQAPDAHVTQAVDSSVPPSQAFSSPERESLSPQHIALLSWWADMMAAGQFPMPAAAAGPDGTAAAEATDGGRTRGFPVKAAAVSLLAVGALGAAAVAGSALDLGL